MKNFPFPKSSRLLTAGQYRHVGRFGEEKLGKFLWVQVSNGRYKHSERKLGITVTRRYGRANKRNRFKRLVREAFRLFQSSFPSHVYIHVRPSTPFVELSLQDVERELIALVAQATRSEPSLVPGL